MAACTAPSPAAEPAVIGEHGVQQNLGAGGSEVEWIDFVAREVTPRFPDGFTVVDAAGQWRDARRGSILHEGSKLIEIVLPGGSDDRVKIEAIAEAYKRRFEQQSVGLIINQACVRF